MIGSKKQLYRKFIRYSVTNFALEIATLPARPWSKRNNTAQLFYS